MYIFFIPSSVYRHLTRFCKSSTESTYRINLVIVNSAIINMGMQISVIYTDFISFGYMPKDGRAGSYGSYIFSFIEEHLH
jgi:hypothetical protein